MLGMRLEVLITIIGLALTASACSAPLEFPEWTIPVPEGTRIIEYAGVPLEARTEVLEPVADLVIDASDGDPQKAFYRPLTVSVDPSSERIYVYDAGNHRIQVFDRDGMYVRTIGREGRGPGELESGGRTAITDGHLVHVGLEGMNVWDLDGQLVSSQKLEFRLFSDIIGLPGGRLVGFTWERPDQDTRLKVFRRIELEGAVEHEYMRPEDPGSPAFRRPNRMLSSRAPVGAPDFAASATGDLYFASADEYQVLATDASVETRWAMRVTWSRVPITDDEIDEWMTMARERMPDASRDEIDWPSHRPALARAGSVQVNGQGNLFVFPTVPPEWPEDRRPVDVYSRDGEVLFSGSMPRINWRAALGDHVYALETDSDTEESILVRYRLELPGGR